MILKRKIVPFSILVSLYAVFFTGCAINYKTVVDAQLVPSKNQEKLYDLATSTLIRQGFELRLADKDVGFIITEYKKYGQAGNNSPFDFYLQIIVRLKQIDGKSVIILEPKERIVNRFNSAAFTEINTVFFNDTKDTKDTKDKNSHRLNFVVRKPGFLLFTDVVKAIAADFGTSRDQIKLNTVDRMQIIVKSDDTLK
jgi:hypothetical protein